MNILLHSCCAPCSAAIIEYLLKRGDRPVIYWYNPNIFPQEEHEIRKNELMRHASSLGLEVIDGGYDHQQWMQHIAGLEDEPERGARCLRCFELRMQAAAMVACKRGIAQFATTLASSRWKNLDQIAVAGQSAASQAGAVAFLNENWRKGGLSERRIALLRQHGFYNQRYCGCLFSITPKKII